MPKQTHHAPNRLPLHVEISEMLAREINAGILLKGTKLSPERVMANKLGVSVGTLRKALLDLEQKDLIQRVHGSGNYVRGANVSATIKANTIYGFFRLELIKGGGLPTAQIISVDRINKPKNMPNIGNNAQGHRVRRIRRLNGVDAALEEIWIDGDRCPSIAESELSDSLYLFYKEKLGFWITHAEDSVSVMTPPQWQPVHFAARAQTETPISEKPPQRFPAEIWGYIERLSYDQHNECVEFSKTWFDPKTTRFVARWN